MILLLKGKEFKNLEITSRHYSNVIVKNINSDHRWSDKHRAVMSQGFCDEIIREFTKEGDVVLDPFMGLGTTGLSCAKQNRNFIGVEIHKPYFDIAEKRMKEETSQHKLFEFMSQFQA